MNEQVSGPLVLGQLGRELRRLRNAAGLTQSEIAKRLRVSQDTISNMERGRRWPTDKQVAAFLKLYNAPAGVAEHIDGLARRGRTAGRRWWDDYDDVFPAKNLQFFAYEDAASRIFSFSGTYVPGILQTRRYAEILAAFFRADQSQEHRARFVQLRLRRQERLSHENFVGQWLFQESAVLAHFGDREDRREQLSALISASERPNVSLRIIPLSAGPAATMSNPFTVMEFASEAEMPVLYNERERNGTIDDTRSVVDAARRSYRNLLDNSLNEKSTRDLLKKGLEKL